MTELLVVAVYGTLRRGERNHGLLDGAAFLGTGWVSGSIHHIGGTPSWPYAYPGLVPEPAGRVLIEIYRITGDAMLAALDDLEQFDPADPDGSPYARRVVPVIDGPVDHASVYFYQGTGEDLGDIVSGGDWVARRGLST
jgi:gamma-glutamylcyclotransferase (GGCT)/AIG2-like uncharacterized protein YtfP